METQAQKDKVSCPTLRAESRIRASQLLFGNISLCCQIIDTWNHKMRRICDSSEFIYSTAYPTLLFLLQGKFI